MSGKKRRREDPDAPEAVLAHVSPGRLRVKFPDLRGQSEQLESLCEACVKLPGVTQAEGRTSTGSVIILVEGDTDAVIRAASAEGVFSISAEIEAEQRSNPAADAKAWEARADSLLSVLGGSSGNLRHASALAFLFMAMLQAASGRIMPPAASALLTAVGLALGASRLAEEGVLTDGDE